jgi:hypothetical protein
LILGLVLATCGAALMCGSAAAQISFTEGADTVTTPKFALNFGDGSGNVERMEGLEWRNSEGTLSGNLAASGGGSCGDPSEFWGESYGNADGFGPGPVVGGSRGTWVPRGHRTVEISASAPTNCSGDEPPVPVRTRYTFFDTGSAANKIRIERRWSFAANQKVTNPAQGMRAYVPRLPVGTYNEEIHPDSSGEELAATEGVCNVCVTTNWDQTWVAVNASSTDAGMVILRDPSDAASSRIVVDYDSASGSNNTGVSLDKPEAGWVAPVTEVEYLCFYDADSWDPESRSATSLPPGCSPAAVPINTVPPAVSAGAGAPEPGKQFTATPGTWEGAQGSLTHHWSRCIGSSCEPIGGATGTTYTASAADVGHYLRVTETATAPGGETDSADSSVAGSLSGHVTEGGEGMPSVGAPVQACLVGGGPCRSTTSGAAGFYKIQAPVSGEYTVTGFPPASSHALPRTRSSNTTVVDEAETMGQDILLQLPQLPPPEVGFSGAGARGKTAEGVPVVHWQEPFVIEYKGKINAKVEGEIEYPDGESVPLPPPGPPAPDPEDPEEGTFKFPVDPLYPHHGPANVTIKVEPPEPAKEITFPIYIDPSGFVRTTDGAPIANARVTLFRADTAAGPFAQVPDGSAVMSPMNRANPDVTEANGHFGWDVIAGFYSVRAEASGCHAPGSASQAFVETGALEIPPPVTNLDIRLECPTLVEPAIRPVEPLRASLSLPRRVGKVKIKKNGAFSVKSARIGCPAASQGPCTAAVGVTGTLASKSKGRASRAKALSLGSSTIKVQAGRTASVTGRLSKKGARRVEAAKRLKGKISVSVKVPGGETTAGSIRTTLVPASTR